MKKYQEEHMLFTHQDRKLEAVFVHQPTDDAKRAKEMSDFFAQMQCAFQKFVETSDFFKDELDCEENEKEDGTE